MVWADLPQILINFCRSNISTKGDKVEAIHIEFKLGNQWMVQVDVGYDWLATIVRGAMTTDSA